MQKLKITGGVKLNGEVTIAGAKNAALPMLCAGLLTDQSVTLRNVPKLHDVATLCKLLEQMGMTISRNEDGSAVLNASGVNHPEASYEMVKTMRASILVLGPLLARFGRARVSLPGGCAIGSRPVEQHIKGLTAMGATINIENGYIDATAPRLKGVHIVTDMVTVTGTENLLMAATLAEGVTVIENAAREPEVSNLAYLLQAMGAEIHGIETNRLEIVGKPNLHGVAPNARGGTIIADRIEAGTFLCVVAATGGKVTLINPYPDASPSWINSLDAVVVKLQQMGAVITQNQATCSIEMKTRPICVDFRTQEFPGFPTDMQAQLMVVNCIASGVSRMTETIFENRFMHVNELCRLGADISLDGHTAICRGVESLTAAPVMATDLRASASLVIAALVAQGNTEIERIYHLDRGYEAMEIKLRNLGALVERIA